MPPAVLPRSPAPAAFPRATRQPLVRPRVRSVGKPAAPPQDAMRRLLLGAFAGLIVIVASKFTDQGFDSVAGAILIIIAAMLPSYLWVRGKVRGLPLFPACALTCVWTYSLPLVSEHPIVALFPGSNQLGAAVSVAGFLLIGTAVWYWVARRPARPPVVCWTMDQNLGMQVFLAALGGCLLWTVVSTAGWVHLPTGLDSIARALLLAVEALSGFILSYLMGSGRMNGSVKIIYLALLGSLLVSMLPALLLIVAMSLVGIALMAYAVASRRLPWLVSLLAFCVFGFLHFGKGEMRERYWNQDVQISVSPLQYPGFFKEWFDTSVKVIRSNKADEDNGENLLERASLMHWLLYFQAVTPNAIPYLSGDSYTPIPRLLIPRFLDPDKPHGNEGNTVLSVHYGIQTREDTDITTIAYGLLSEAYANFGYLGMAGLAVVLGAIYGKAAQWASGMPILSFRALFTVLIASMSFQAELSATSYVTMMFQSSMVLLLFTAVFMRPRPVDRARVSVLD